MENKGLSITIRDNTLSDTGVSAKSFVVQKSAVSVAFLATMLSISMLAGNPAITNNISVGFNGADNMISITDSETRENNLEKQDYSFISAMGFEDDSVSYPDMFV